MSTWWRAYNSSIHHKKLLKLSDEMHRAWYTLMCIASDNGGALPPADDIAVTLRIRPEKVATWLAALVRAELFDNVDGVFHPHNWATRQYKHDAKDPTGAKRAKEYRDRKRAERDASRRDDRDVTDVTTVRNERPDQSRSDTDQIRADADDRLRDEISAKYGFADLARVSIWLSKGYSETLIRETITAVVARSNGPITSTAYFDRELADAHANRVPGPSERVAPDMDATIALWAKTGVWSRWAGPEPGQINCRATAEQLAQHGFGKDGMRLARSA